MTKTIASTCELKTWDESAFSEIEGGEKLSRASVTKSFTGEIEADGTLEYLMSYHEDGSAGFVGYERVVGRVGERTGSFVLRHVGLFEGDAARADLTVEANSSTGDLRGLRGEGRLVWPHGQPGQVTLDIDFE